MGGAYQPVHEAAFGGDAEQLAALLDEDPPVYRFGDGAGGSYQKAFDSFWDFIAEMVTYDEVLSRKRLS